MLGADKAYFIAHYYLIYRPEKRQSIPCWPCIWKARQALKCWCLAARFNFWPLPMSMPCQKWRELTRNPRSRQQVKKQSCMQGSILLFVVQRQIYFAVDIIGAVTTYASHKAQQMHHVMDGYSLLIPSFQFDTVLYRQAYQNPISR